MLPIEVLILGDSLTLGRPKHGITRMATWPYLLAKSLGAHLCVRSQPTSTVRDVREEVRKLSAYWIDDAARGRFSIALVQVGIVDTTPRLLPRNLYPYLSRTPLFRRLMRKRGLHEAIGRPWVSDLEWRRYISATGTMLERLADQFFFIEIAPLCGHLIDNCGDYSKSIEARNSHISRIHGERSLIRYLERPGISKHFLPDGHHLNKNGHHLLAQKCLDAIHG